MSKELQTRTEVDSSTTDAQLPSANLAQNPLLAESGDEYVSPYCPTCESCGHEGCCNFIQCFSSLIDNKSCDNGKQYLADARFHFRISQLSDEVINNLENGLYDARLAVEKYRKEWDEIWDNIYKTSE